MIRILPRKFRPFYVWPNVYFPFRHYFQDKRLNIFIIENIVHNFNWLDECKNKIKDSHFFFVYCGWYMDNHHAKHYHEMFEYLKLNKNNFFFLFNSIQEKNFLEQKGFFGELINHNAWIDENIIKPEVIEKKYDAILVSRQRDFKRHYLARKVDKLAIVAGGNNHCGPSLSYSLPPHIYNNDKPLNIEEVCKKINQSYCGLMLSAMEGACFSSSEYLLCGIPVVSTKSLGGRDFWYNDYNSIICDDDEDSVAESVEFFKNNPRDGDRIRKDHILLAQKQKEKFINILQLVFNKYNVQINAKDYFEKNYYHKMRRHTHIDEVKNIFS